MKFAVSLTPKHKADMRISFAAAILYRQVFLSDLFQDMVLLTDENVIYDAEKIEKLFGIVWVHIKNAAPKTLDYMEWKRSLPGVKAIEVVRAIMSMWSICSHSVIDAPAGDDRQREGLDPCLALYQYLARKAKIEYAEFVDMTPGELLDQIYMEAKMHEVEADPTYKATQVDFDTFFN